MNIPIALPYRSQQVGFWMIIFITIFNPSHSQNNLDQWKQIESEFPVLWTPLQNQFWPLGFKEFLDSIPATEFLSKQNLLLNQFSDRLKLIDEHTLPAKDQLKVRHFRYFLEFNKKLVVQSIAWRKATDSTNLNSATSIGQVIGGKQWYRLFLQKYTSINISPDSVYRYGLESSRKLGEQLALVKSKLDKGFEDWATDTVMIAEEYDRIQKNVRDRLSRFFPLEVIADYPVIASPIINSTSTTPPAFYGGLTKGTSSSLYYNYFEGRHNLANAGWTYLHEAIPGHHLQSIFLEKIDKTFLDEFANYQYNGLFEGWACYVERYGYQAGIYADPHREYAYLQWNLIRCMRLCLDVGLNYYGWSEDQAYDFWNLYLPEQSALMHREVTRCMTWPAQATSYVIGAASIQQMKEKFIVEGKSEKSFHEFFLKAGMIPLQILTR